MAGDRLRAALREACPRVGRLIGGCRWEGRFDVAEPSISSKNLPPLMSGDVKHLVRRETYIRDVCRTCGAVMERAAQEPGR